MFSPDQSMCSPFKKDKTFERMTSIIDVMTKRPNKYTFCIPNLDISTNIDKEFFSLQASVALWYVLHYSNPYILI